MGEQKTSFRYQLMMETARNKIDYIKKDINVTTTEFDVLYAWVTAMKIKAKISSSIFSNGNHQ